MDSSVCCGCVSADSPVCDVFITAGSPVCGGFVSEVCSVVVETFRRVFFSSVVVAFQQFVQCLLYSLQRDLSSVMDLFG